jgi:hypothetical protein
MTGWKTRPDLEHHILQLLRKGRGPPSGWTPPPTTTSPPTWPTPRGDWPHLRLGGHAHDVSIHLATPGPSDRQIAGQTRDDHRFSAHAVASREDAADLLVRHAGEVQIDQRGTDREGDERDGEAPPHDERDVSPPGDDGADRERAAVVLDASRKYMTEPSALWKYSAHAPASDLDDVSTCCPTWLLTMTMRYMHLAPGGGKDLIAPLDAHAKHVQNGVGEVSK